MLRAEKTSDGPVGDGTTFETAYRGFGRMALTIREYRRPEHVVVDGDGPRVRMHFVMDVAARDAGGSHVTLPREMAKRPAQFRAASAADSP
jgi:hypothetical protein